EYGSGPDQFAAQAYTGLLVLDHAVRVNCSGERTDVQDGLTQVKDLKTPRGSLTINKDRAAEHSAVVQIVKDGKFAVLNCRCSDLTTPTTRREPPCCSSC